MREAGKRFRTLKRLLLYGGLERENYQQISPEIDEFNRKNLVIIAGACAVVYTLRLCITYAKVPYTNKILFLTAVMLFTLIAFVNHKAVSGRRLVHVSAYLFMAVYLSVGIFAAVGESSVSERTTLYLVFVTALPMMFALNAVELGTVVVSAEVLYLLVIARYQSSYPVYHTNQSNSIFFSISGLLLGIYMSNMKISGIYNAYMNARMQEIRERNEELRQNREELRLALAEAEHANRAKTTFLNSMSHDIRTPMNAIIGFTTLAKSHLDDQEKAEDYLDKVTVAGNHLLSLINDVLDMSRIESGTIRIEENPVSLQKLISEAGTIIQTSASEKHLEFSVQTEVSHDRVITDEVKLNQILVNILGNAVKFTPDGGEIHFSVKETDSADGFAAYEFRIRDTGIGMKKEFLTHIFEPFTREENAAVGKIEGTGLGMSITKNIVERMGGRIGVESEEGKGTEFTIWLRFALQGAESCAENSTLTGTQFLNQGGGTHEAFAAGSMEEEKRNALQAKMQVEGREGKNSRTDFAGRSVLLVEDNELNQEIAATILREEGFVVDVAEDGFAALEWLQDSEALYDVILMDVQMPGMSGYEATRRIRAMSDPKKAGIPIIAMTANAFEEDRRAAHEAGMNGHVTKPIETEKLLEMIERVLSGRSEWR